jgi:hypothetical protein
MQPFIFKRRLDAEAKKASVFLALDILMVMLFTFVWFKYILRKENPVETSLAFTIVMQLFFITYYTVFDYIWEEKITMN